jgi:exopolysaccharide biosynthesis protein
MTLRTNPLRKGLWLATFQLGTVLTLVLLAFLCATQSLQVTRAQESKRRFTESLKLEEVAPGVEYGQIVAGTSSKDERNGPWLINVLRLDLQRARLKIVHAMDEGVGLETVSSLAARYQATAAVNGGYFRTTGTYRGEPIGLFVLNRKLISEPYNERAGLGLIETGNRTEVVLGHRKFSAEISVGRAKHKVEGLNRPVAKDELIVFTPEFHRTTLTAPGGVEVIVRKNMVATVRDALGSSEIPSDGYVVSAAGSSSDWIKRNVRKGSRMIFTWKLTSLERTQDEVWERAHSQLGAGPQLIKGGKVEITEKQEKMAELFAEGRHPRTAIAKLASGRLLLVTVDGRQPGVSVGMSLDMLAELLLEFGAVEAINLDGGGSTTMVVKNQVVNKPSDQTGERPVSDATLVFSKAN